MTVRLRPDAESDLDEAAKWYEEQRPRLGSKFLDEVLRVLLAISAQPEGFPVVHREVRRAVTRRFPFGVYFLASTTWLDARTWLFWRSCTEAEIQQAGKAAHNNLLRRVIRTRPAAF